MSDSWKELLDRWEKHEVQEAANRVQRYLAQAQCILNLPIAEAVITYKGKRSLIFKKHFYVSYFY